MSLRFETGRAHRPPGRPGGRVVLGVALLLLGAAQAQHPGNTPRRWRAAAYASERHQVSTTLLVAIGCHENPSPSRDWFACGCIGRRNRGLHQQFDAAAQLCRRVLGDRALSPTSADLQRLNRTYAEDAHWWRRVNALYRRML